MNDIKTCCIDSRRNAFASFNITDKDLLEEIDSYFKEVEDFASNCSDVADFESKFASSSLATRYTDLFTKVVNSGSSTGTDQDSLAKDIASEAVDDVVMAGRRKAHQEVYDQARDIPVVGDVLNVKQHVDFFSRFKKNKDK